MVFNATFNNIAVYHGGKVLLMEETAVPKESHRPVAIHWQTLSHSCIAWMGFELTLVVIGTDCIGSCKYYMYNVLFLFIDIGWEDYISQAQGWV